MAIAAGLVWSTFAGSLTNFSVVGSNTAPGATSTYTISFTTETTVAAAPNMILETILPSGFTCNGNINDLSVTVDGEEQTVDESTYYAQVENSCFVFLRITNSVPWWSDVVVNIANITNHASLGTYNFGLNPYTADAGWHAYDTLESTASITIAYLPLQDFIWTATNFVPGGTASYTFSFTAVNELAAYPNSTFYFWFPFVNHTWWTGENLDDDIDLVVNNVPAISTGSSIQNGERIWILPQDAIPTWANVSITLNNVVNYNQAGSYNWTALAETDDYNTNERRVATEMNPIVLAYPQITLEYALDRCSANSGSILISEEECDGLAYLFDETNGNNWDNHNGWFSNTDLSTWETDSCYTPVDGDDWCSNGAFNWPEYWRAIEIRDIGTGDTHYVIHGINLAENNLTGAIITGLAHFQFLTNLDIQDNYLTSVDLTHNSFLREFDVSDNQDEWATWTLDLSNNFSLRSLNADDLNLATIDLSHNTSLEYIDLDGNYLSGLNLSGLNALRSLDISDNEFESWSNLTISSSVLHDLDVSNNSIGIINLSGFTSLVEFYADNNELLSISLWTLPNLNVLELYSNELSTIDLEGVYNIHDLQLQFNNLSSLDISANEHISSLDASSNQITQFTIGSIEDHSDLEELDLDYNGLCYIDDQDTIDFLDDVIGEGWQDYQFFCAPRNVTAIPGDHTSTITWTAPAQSASNSEDATPLYYTAAMIWGTGEYEVNNETFSYTFGWLSNNITYLFRVCAVHSNEWPNRTVCETVSVVPAGEETHTVTHGGGGGGASRDYCPDGDNSSSYYDDTCGEVSPVDENIKNESGVAIVVSIICLDPEYQDAYDFAFSHSITTIPNCIDANMDGLLTRAHAAKMMSNYAIDVLGKKPDTTKVCNFSDMGTQSSEMQLYAKAACQLGIMGLETDGLTPSQEFNPNASVDKAQFATILDRLINGRAHDGNTTCRYCDHVQALQDAGIIKVVSDLFEPLKRAFAMIMLMRTQH